MKNVATCLVIAVALGGCYHAIVNTGIEPGPQQVEDKWADGFVSGLVPPDPVDAMEECGDAGVARVETRLSFLNQIAQGLTFGIYSPMEIVVTCGEGEEDGG